MTAEPPEASEALIHAVLDAHLMPQIAKIERELKKHLPAVIVLVAHGTARKLGYLRGDESGGEVRTAFVSRYRPHRYRWYVEARYGRDAAPGTGWTGFVLEGRGGDADGKLDIEGRGLCIHYNKAHWNSELQLDRTPTWARSDDDLIWVPPQPMRASGKRTREVRGILKEKGILELEHVLEIGRWVSKTGGLSATADDLKRIAGIVTSDEVIALFERLKEYRDESEWRDEFEEIFPAFAPELPDPE